MKIYLDTNVVSLYCTKASRSEDHQDEQWVTTRWLWELAHRRRVRFLTSWAVRDEAAKGIDSRAKARLLALRQTTCLPVHRADHVLAKELGSKLDAQAAAAVAFDLLHFAVAWNAKAECLVTWNLRHFNLIHSAASKSHLLRWGTPDVQTPLKAAIRLENRTLPNPLPRWVVRLEMNSPLVQRLIDEETRAGRKLAKSTGLLDAIKEARALARGHA